MDSYAGVADTQVLLYLQMIPVDKRSTDIHINENIPFLQAVAAL